MMDRDRDLIANPAPVTGDGVRTPIEYVPRAAFLRHIQKEEKFQSVMFFMLTVNVIVGTATFLLLWLTKH